MIRGGAIITRRVVLQSALRSQLGHQQIPAALCCNVRRFSQQSPTPSSSSSAASAAQTALSNKDDENKPKKQFNGATMDFDEDENEPKLTKQQMVVNGVKTLAVTVKGWVMNPRQTWKSIKEEAHHYWVGSKLLWSEIQLTKQILGRVLRGNELTRRERKQLVRTSSDLFRLIPFAIIVAVPFMELLLPVLLKVFPNMLPSTFEDKTRQQESAQKELKMRMAVSRFMQESLQEIASKKTSHDVADVQELTQFIDNARLGVAIPTDKVVQMAKLFKDELTLANIARPQLLALCRYMNLQTYGSDSFLRFQLRNKLRNIKEDDRRILWEGVDSLNTLELREACRERGMQSIGLTQFHLRHQLQEWLQLSTEKNLPISLLIMSRAFQLTSHRDDPEVVLKESMSALDSDTINEVVLASASQDAQQTVELRKRKIESLKFQQEMIAEEIEGANEIRKKLNDEKTQEEDRKKIERERMEEALSIKPIVPTNVKDSVEHSSSSMSSTVEDKKSESINTKL